MQVKSKNINKINSINTAWKQEEVIVNRSPLERVVTDHLGHEFFPPLDARDTWERPWETHLSMHQAWQEAGGNTDGEACQWLDPDADMIVPALEPARSGQHRGPFGGSGPDGADVSMQTVVRMNTLLTSLRERLLQITNEASNIAIAEMSLRQVSTANALNASAASASMSRLHRENAQRVVELVRAWFSIISAAQARMASLVTLEPATESRVDRRVSSGEQYPLFDRRRAIVAIAFPDRRMAA